MSLSSDPADERAGRERLLAAIEQERDRALELARWMGHHPEISLEEYETSLRYVEFLLAAGFEVERPVAGLETAFVARRSCGDAPLRAALLAEMDALPVIGHACGHNLSGPASLLAAAALARALPHGTIELRVVGCPGEEIGAGKRRLVEAGVFRDVHLALMAHASNRRRAHRLFLGNRKFEFVYRGRAAHAAAHPECGINALDSVIQLFVAIGALRQQLHGQVRIHGIVTDGGQAPNVIPERAAARVWVRAPDDATLGDATERLLACARAAAEASGAKLEIRPEQGTSPPLLPNLALAAVYRRQLERLGLPEMDPAPDRAIGSSDITHVSRVVPTIHPNFPIGEEVELHTREFAAATLEPRGEEGLVEAARALALTLLELARQPALRQAIEQEFRERLAVLRGG
jgi:amidohydrolase